nr:hypothetical protein B0A51_00822 [Rachicladosporium sp. CCFEE 5018]
MSTTTPTSSLQPMTPDNLASSLKSSTSLSPATSTSASSTTASTTASKPKPCCVCKDEKAARDECMLFSTAKDPQAACQDMVSGYRRCMEGFGFSIP